ncbi:MraY family glycosyltransferase [Desulfothermus sp.]
MTVVFTIIIISFFITISIIPVLYRIALKYNLLLDLPSKRKMHERPVPRIGGIGMALAFFVTTFMWVPKNEFFYAFLIGCGIIVFFGVLDDLFSLGYKPKFSAQIIAAVVLIVYGKVRILSVGNILPEDFCLSDWSSFLLTLVVIVGITNAINLADGLDGLAGGICLLAFSCIAYLAYLVHMPIILLFCASMIGSILGFLRFNTYPATIFMGDTGSQLLGFSGIILAIKLTQESIALSPVLPALIFGVPILDTLSVMTQRMMEKRPLFKADKNHFHHKLIRLGLFHTEAVVVLYTLQFLFILWAIIFRTSSSIIILLGFIIFLVLTILFFIFVEKRDYKLVRFEFITNLKSKLRDIREQGFFIKWCFFALKIFLPVLMVFISFVPANIPKYLSIVATAIVILLLISIGTGKILNLLLRLIAYMFFPYLIFLGEQNSYVLTNHSLLIGYNLLFLLVTTFSVLTIKLTRRRSGFYVTPMDILILLIITSLFIIPADNINIHKVGMIAAKSLIILFGYEVLIGELRKERKALIIFILGVLIAIIIRGFCAI